MKNMKIIAIILSLFSLISLTAYAVADAEDMSIMGCAPRCLAK